MFTKYNVKIGDSLWTALYNHIKDNYSIESVCEENGQKFAILNTNDKYYRLNFSISEDNTVEFEADNELLENYIPDEEPQFNPADVAAYVESKEVEEKDSNPQLENPEEDKKEKYNLEEIQEYVELSNKYSALETNYNNAQSIINTLQAQVNELTQFKAKIEKAEKEKMIASFYMLSEQDKKDVIDNIDKYSLDDIEAKLSIICVRNKVSFNLDDDKNKSDNPTTFNLDSGLSDEAPAWIKAIRSVASNM